MDTHKWVKSAGDVLPAGQGPRHISVTKVLPVGHDAEDPICLLNKCKPLRACIQPLFNLIIRQC